MENLDLCRTLKPRFILYTKKLYLYCIPKPRLISHTKTQIYIAYQSPDLYRIPKPRFTSHTKTQIYTIYQYLDLCNLTKPRFTLYTKHQIYTEYQNLDLYYIPIPIFISYNQNIELYGILKRFGDLSRMIWRVVQNDTASCLQRYCEFSRTIR